MTTETQNLTLDQIRIDGGTQPRVAIDEHIVAEYADLYANGVNLPPVTVFFDGATYWLADGFHRYWANKRIDCEYVFADIHQGTQRDAILHSVGANADHGLRRTNADKRKAVLTMLEDEEWSGWHNVDPASMIVIGGGKTRSMADILNIAGENGDVGHHRLAALRAMLGGFGNPPLLSSSETSEALRRHHDAIEFALAQLPTVVSARGVNTATTRAVVARSYYSVDHTTLKDFCRKLTTGIVTSAEEGMVVLLRQHLQENRGSSYSQRMQRYGKVQRALSAWLKGENPTRLYPASGEQFPLPEEVRA